MALYPYTLSLAVDPVTMQKLSGATGQIYLPTDTAFASPLTATDPSGNPVTLTANADGILPIFYATSPKVNWRSGSWVFPLVTTEPLPGPQGSPGAPGAPGQDGSNVVPTQAAIAQAVSDPASAARVALEDTFALSSEAARQADQAALADQAVGIARVAQAFSRPPGGISVSREGSDYWLWHGLGSGMFSRYQLKNYTANAGNLPLRQLAYLDTVQAMFDTAQTAASVTGTWVAGSNAGSVGGAYRYSTTAGDTMTWTSPAGSTSVGVSVVEITNGAMLVSVEVNGSKTAADRLFTAQDVVDKGWYPNTILTTNGGTLAPTDRVMDSYSSATATNNFAARRVLTSGLTAGAHTVKLTNTGYMRNTLTGQRAYVTGFLNATPSTLLSSAGAKSVTDTILSGVASAWEYAYYGQPAGTTAPGETGNIHGWEVELSLTFTIDGNVVNIADLTRVDANRDILVTRVTQLRHVELGTTAIADVVTTYRLDRRGLRVDVQTKWNRDYTPIWMWLMLPVNGATTNAAGMKFNRGNLMNYAGGAITFTGANGDIYPGRSKSVAAWMWSSTGKFGVMAAIPDHTTFLNRWDNSVSPTFAQLNDRSGNISKAYFPRAMAGGDVIKAGTIMTSSIRYTVGYFPEGAETALASL